MTVEELEDYFTGIQLPDELEMVQGVVIVDLPLFLESHFSYIKDNPGLKSTDVFLERLNNVHDLLEAKSAKVE